jgi:hypothetical protein
MNAYRSISHRHRRLPNFPLAKRERRRRRQQQQQQQRGRLLLASSSSDSVYLFDGDEHLCPLQQTRISITTTKNESITMDVVKPPSVDELYEWYVKYANNDADPSWADVWPTEIALVTRLIEKNKWVLETSSSSSFAEVGAGLSFAGVMLAKHFGKKGLLLDREPLALHCALSTAKVNGVEVVSCDAFEDFPGGAVAAALFDWSKRDVTRESLQLTKKVEMVIGADVLYDPETCRDLANACSILGEKAILCELRRERAIGLQAKFFDECEKLGARKCEIDEDMSCEEYVFLVVEF